MDIQSQLLNKKWKNYFNWTVVYPTVLFFVSIMLVFSALFMGFASIVFKTIVVGLIEPLVGIMMAIVGTMTFGFVALTIGVFVYLIWFVIASDNLFKMLNINRVAGNVLNLIGLFVFPGLSLLILPIFFWIKMRDYWDSKGINASWRAVV